MASASVSRSHGSKAFSTTTSVQLQHACRRPAPRSSRPTLRSSTLVTCKAKQRSGPNKLDALKAQLGEAKLELARLEAQCEDLREKADRMGVRRRSCRLPSTPPPEPPQQDDAASALNNAVSYNRTDAEEETETQWPAAPHNYLLHWRWSFTSKSTSDM